MDASIRTLANDPRHIRVPRRWVAAIRDAGEGGQHPLQFAIWRILRTNPEKSRTAEAALRNSQWPQAGPKDFPVSEQTDGRRS